MTGKTLARWRASFQTPQGDILTQAQAAAWYGVHERTWRGFENGRYRDGQVPKPLVSLTQSTTHIIIGGAGYKRINRAH